MTKRHILLYDILLPACFVAAVGRILSEVLAEGVYRWLASVQLWGLGDWFIKSNFGRELWDYRWLLFSVPPLLLWALWMRINLQYDWVSYRYKMDRPIFSLFQGFFRWVEGGDALARQKLAYQQELAVAQDNMRRLEFRLKQAGLPVEKVSPAGMPEPGISEFPREISVGAVESPVLQGSIVRPASPYAEPVAAHAENERRNSSAGEPLGQRDYGTGAFPTRRGIWSIHSAGENHGASLPEETKSPPPLSKSPGTGVDPDFVRRQRLESLKI